MNPELEKQLEVLVEKAAKATESTGEFVIEQAPILLQEFYAWRTTHHIAWIVLPIIVMVGFYIATRLAGSKEPYPHPFSFKLFGKHYEEGNVWHISLVVLFSAALFFGPIIVVKNAMDLIQLSIAPRLYLIEYFL